MAPFNRSFAIDEIACLNYQLIVYDLTTCFYCDSIDCGSIQGDNSHRTALLYWLILFISSLRCAAVNVFMCIFMRF